MGNRYLKVDLEDYADLEAIDDDPESWGQPSRSEILQQSLGLNSGEIKSICSGGYQGEWLFVFRIGGYLWLLKDSYGSCPVCDGLLAADHAKHYAEGMMRNAYAFDDDNEAVRFLHEKDGDGAELSTFSYGWSPLVDDGISAITELAERSVDTDQGVGP